MRSGWWLLDHESTQYAMELLEGKEEKLDADVTMIRLARHLQTNEFQVEHLFIRPDSRALWDEVLEYCEKRKDSHFIVTGNPGIGKSRSMTYLLLQLLRKKKVVVYEARKDKVVWKFEPTSAGEYKVWKCNLLRFYEIFEPALDDPENYFLVDPDIAQGSPTHVRAHTIFTPPPNMMHYHWFQDRPYVITLYMPSWSKEELEAIRPFMKVYKDHVLNSSELSDRYIKFGGTPRMVFAHRAQYADFYHYLQLAVESLTEQDVVNVLNGSEYIDAAQSTERTTLLFAYCVRRITDPAMAGHKLTYICGLNNCNVTIASEYVCWAVLSKYWSLVMHRFSTQGWQYNRNIVAVELLFQVFAKTALTIGGTFRAKLLRGHENNIQTEETKEEILDLEYAQIYTPLTSDWNNLVCSFEHSSTQISTNKHTRRIVFPPAKFQPFVDVIDATDRVYKIVTSLNLRLNISCLGTLITGCQAGNKSTKVYFVVPEALMKDFTKPIDNNNINSTNQIKSSESKFVPDNTFSKAQMHETLEELAVQQDVDNNVKQYVLCIEGRISDTSTIKEAILKDFHKYSEFIV